MSKYVDGFVLALPKNKLASYRKMSEVMGKLMKKYGALEYVEAIGDDMNPKMMAGTKFLKFPKMAQAKPKETVVFSFITYKSRASRDQVNAKVMKDPVMDDPKMKNAPMPFDMERMAYGGFKTIIDL